MDAAYGRDSNNITKQFILLQTFNSAHAYIFVYS